MPKGYVPIVAIDFDGTITDSNCYPKCSPPREGAIEAIKELHNMGCHLTLWTCRAGEPLHVAVQYLKAHGVLHCFKNFNTNAEQLFETFDNDCRKIFANYYVDDLNIGGFIGWDKVLEIIKKDAYFAGDENVG